MVVLTVADTLAYLKELFETNATLSDLWVMGEISNLSRSSAGHLYFTLKDGVGQLRCAFFRRQNAGIELEHGAQLLVHGRVSVYEQRGELNFIVDYVHSQGEGILNAQFERLKQLLEAEGLFDVTRKRPLPLFPNRIGLVTSPTGAVLHDIRTVVGRRWPLAQLILAPTPVQGDGAAPGIVAALQELNELGNVDVIILARGGGSLEELWAFNEEAVQRAIYASRVPVVSAVGHETDITLADYVADLRAPTPSAAAELVVPDQIEIAMRVGAYTAMLESCIQRELSAQQDGVARLADYLEQECPDLAELSEGVLGLVSRAGTRLSQSLAERRSQIDMRIVQLASLDPCAVLERGYAVVHRADGTLLASVNVVRTGEAISIRLRDGTIAAEVGEVHAG